MLTSTVIPRLLGHLGIKKKYVSSDNSKSRLIEYINYRKWMKKKNLIYRQITFLNTYSFCTAYFFLMEKKNLAFQNIADLKWFRFFFLAYSVPYRKHFHFISQHNTFPFFILFYHSKSMTFQFQSQSIKPGECVLKCM